MKMSPYYIHSEVLLYYKVGKKKNERNEAGKENKLSILKTEMTPEP